MPDIFEKMIRKGAIAMIAVLTLAGSWKLMDWARSPSRQPGEPGTLHVRIRQAPVTFDWNRAEASADGVAIKNLAEGLVQIGTDHQLTGALAESWSLSEDGGSLRFILREGLTWSDGVPLTSHDFVAGWKRLLDPKDKKAGARLLFEVAGARDYRSGDLKDFSQVGIKAVSDREILIQVPMAGPDWIWTLSRWQTFPVPAHAIKKLGAAWADPGNLVSSGPYLLREYKDKKLIVLERNPRFYGTTGNARKVLVHVENDDASAIAKYTKGEYDLLAKISDFDRQSLPGEELISYAAPRTFTLIFGTDVYPTDAVENRRAIAHAIDKEAIVRKLDGRYAVAGSIIPPGLPGYLNTSSDSNGPRPASMNEPTGLVLDSDHAEPLTLVTLNYPDTVGISREIKSLIESKLHLAVDLKAVSQSRFASEISGKTARNMYLYAPPVPYPHFEHYLSMFELDSEHNLSHWTDVPFSRNMRLARISRDPATRELHVRDAQERLISQSTVAVPVAHDRNWALVSPRVRGFVPNQYTRYYFKLLSVQQ